MSNITQYGNQALPPAPARLRQKLQAGVATTSGFTEGVRDSFPTISFKGKVWSVKFQGQQTVLKDPQNGYPIPFLDLVLAKGSPHLSRQFYIKQFSEGDVNAPDCWSVDNIKPDPAAPHRQSPTCAGCPQDRFGSKITPDGKQGKACASARRVAAVLPHDLIALQLGPLMLRVPYMSLGNLKAYAEFLATQGYAPEGCVTRVSFDQTSAFPRLVFAFHRPLTDQEYDVVDGLQGDDRVIRILSAAVEGGQEEELDAAAQQGAQSAPVMGQQAVNPTPQQAPPQPVFTQPQPTAQPYAPPPAQPVQQQAIPVQAQPQPPYQPPQWQPPQPQFANSVPPAAPQQSYPQSNPAPTQQTAFAPSAPPQWQPPEIPPGMAQPGMSQPTAPKRTRPRPSAKAAAEGPQTPQATQAPPAAQPPAGNSGAPATRPAPPELSQVLSTLMPPRQ
jgi:hypothetical protein